MDRNTYYGRVYTVDYMAGPATATYLVGDRVRDREDPDSEMVIVSIGILAARDFYVDAIGGTVAEANPEYPEDDTVYGVAYISDLDYEMPSWTMMDPENLGETIEEYNVDHGADITVYHFPESRLEPADAVDE